MYAAVSDVLPELQILSSTQIEKLVFYLKSLHGYYPKSENHVAYYSEFSDKLGKLRNSAEQISFQHKMWTAILIGIAFCVLAGLFLALSLSTLMVGQIGVSIGFLCTTGACVIFSYVKLFRKALLLSKEQDRRYFLTSIRAANSCNELCWAGLFSYTKASKLGPLSDADEELISAQVAELTERLRSALYNDEYFQYSSTKIKAAEQ